MSLLTRLGKLTPSKPRSKKTDPEKVGGAEEATAASRITVGPAGSKGTATVVTPDQRSSGRQPDTSPQVEEKSHPRQGALEIANSTGYQWPRYKSNFNCNKQKLHRILLHNYKRVRQKTIGLSMKLI